MLQAREAHRVRSCPAPALPNNSPPSLDLFQSISPINQHASHLRKLVRAGHARPQQVLHPPVPHDRPGVAVVNGVPAPRPRQQGGRCAGTAAATRPLLLLLLLLLLHHAGTRGEHRQCGQLGGSRRLGRCLVLGQGAESSLLGCTLGLQTRGKRRGGGGGVSGGQLRDEACLSKAQGSPGTGLGSSSSARLTSTARLRASTAARACTDAAHCAWRPDTCGAGWGGGKKAGAGVRRTSLAAVHVQRCADRGCCGKAKPLAGRGSSGADGQPS